MHQHLPHLCLRQSDIFRLTMYYGTLDWQFQRRHNRHFRCRNQKTRYLVVNRDNAHVRYFVVAATDADNDAEVCRPTDWRHMTWQLGYMMTTPALVCSMHNTHPCCVILQVQYFYITLWQRLFSIFVCSHAFT